MKEELKTDDELVAIAAAEEAAHIDYCKRTLKAYKKRTGKATKAAQTQAENVADFLDSARRIRLSSAGMQRTLDNYASTPSNFVTEAKIAKTIEKSLTTKKPLDREGAITKIHSTYENMKKNMLPALLTKGVNDFASFQAQYAQLSPIEQASIWADKRIAHLQGAHSSFDGLVGNTEEVEAVEAEVEL